MANNQLKEELILSTQYFDKKIDDVIKRVNKLKEQGNKAGDGFSNSMSKMISKATGFNGSLTSVIGTLGKFSGVLGGITAGVNLADWFNKSVSEGIRLAEQGEGIRLAFERLNRGNLLSKLREETHNTVTDIELMKQAVKFDDFKLNIDQMGTFLAFAQQKAKDTGESIDYMVNSIVTGLGRKSLPILDNLGLSAAEIREEMAKGGDMVTAVAKIIEKRMKEAGDYVETAADRAKKRETDLENNLEELGRTFQPLKEASDTFFNSLEIGAIQAINSLAPLINQLTEAGRILNEYNNIGGNAKVKRQIDLLKSIQTDTYKKGTYKKQMSNYDSKIGEYEQYLKDFKAWKNGSISALNKLNAFADKYKGGNRFHEGNYNEVQTSLAAMKKERAEYKRQAEAVFNPKKQTKETPTVPTPKPTGGKNNKVDYAVNSVGYLEEKISELNKQIKLQVDSTEIKKLQDEITKTQNQLDELLRPTKKLDTANLIGLDKNGVTGFNLKKVIKDMEKVQIPIKTLPQIFDESVEKINNVLDSYDMGIIGEKKAKELIDSINKVLVSVGLKPIEVKIKTDKEKTLDEVSDLIGNIASSFSTLGDSLELPELNIAGIISQAIATIISGYAQATQQAATLGPWAWVGFSLAGIAQVASIVSQIHSLGGYANGGVIGGSSYGGDRLLARVNSGEAIVTQNQQKHLFELLNNGTTNNTVSGGNVHFVIRGSELHGVLANYNKRNNKLR